MKIVLTENELIHLIKKVIREVDELNPDEDDPEVLEPVLEIRPGMNLSDIGKTQLGVPYERGAMKPKNSKSPGFDCSGFVKWTMKVLGYFNTSDGLLNREHFNSFPGYVQGQYDNKYIEKIEEKEIKPGDLVFFTHKGDKIKGHVGIISKVSEKDFSMIHASSSQGIQEVGEVKKKGWWGKITGYGRPSTIPVLPKVVFKEKKPKTNKKK